MRIAIGPWQWIDDTWQCPGAAYCLDLRPLPLQGQAGGDGGHSIFVFHGESVPDGYTVIASGQADQINGNVKDYFESLFGYRPQSDHLHLALFELMTEGADPSGLDHHKPIMPNILRQQDLYFAGKRVLRRKFNLIDGPGKDCVLTVIQNDLSRVRGDVLQGRSEQDSHRKCLGGWQCVLKISEQEIMELTPSEWEDHETPIDPGTTYSDDFNRSNSSDLGSSWTHDIGSMAFEISSNKALVPSVGSSNTSSARYESNLGFSDMFCEVTTDFTTASPTQFGGPAVRFHSTDETFYFMRGDPSGTELDYVAKCVTGTRTNLANGNNFGGATGVYRVTIEGSSLKGDGPASVEFSITDTSITGNLRAGMIAVSQGLAITLDDWTVTDIAPSGGVCPNIFLDQGVPFMNGRLPQFGRGW